MNETPPLTTENGSVVTPQGEGWDHRIEVRRITRAGLGFIAAGITLAIAWSVLAPLAGAVIAAGIVKVDFNRKVIQHQEGGIVKRVLVRDGDQVVIGQSLITLDDVRVDAQVELLRKTHDSERARSARLEAERSYPTVLRFPADLLARRKEASVAEVLEKEENLHRARRELVDRQIALLRRQSQETRSEVEALTAQLQAEERALASQNEELKINQELLKQNFVQKTRVMTIERAVADYESRRQERKAEIAKAQQRITDIDMRLSSSISTFRQQAADELKDATVRLQDTQERLRPSEDAARRQTITAPVAGEVVNLQVFSTGAVIGPRDVLAEIVPAQKQLLIEARVRPEDINYVRQGVPADVRLTAYSQSAAPMVAGKVTYVSGDRLIDAKSGVPYYLAHVVVAESSLANAPNVKLLAGMPAEVFIRTDERTTLDYVFAPITAYLRRGMREPM